MNARQTWHGTHYWKRLADAKAARDASHPGAALVMFARGWMVCLDRSTPRPRYCGNHCHPTDGGAQ